MRRIAFQYTLQNEDHGPTGNLTSDNSASSKLRPEENNPKPGVGTDTSDETERTRNTSPDMDPHSSTPGTGDMSGRAVTSNGGTGPVTGG